MLNMASLHGSRNGLACGLSAAIPAIIFLLFNFESTTNEYYNELKPFLPLFPVFVFTTCLISNARMIEKKEIFQCSLSCAFCSIILWNFIFQWFFVTHSVLNGYEASFKIIGAGGVIEAQSMSYVLLIAILAGFIRILNLNDIEEATSSQDIHQNLPPKPNWDPRIENLRAELALTNEAVRNLKQELWYFQKR
jgi:energy-coupling factor transporter transmembrane protein EcfT